MPIGTFKTALIYAVKKIQLDCVNSTIRKNFLFTVIIIFRNSNFKFFNYTTQILEIAKKKRKNNKIYNVRLIGKKQLLLNKKYCFFICKPIIIN